MFSSDVNDPDPLGCSAGVCNYDLFIMNPDGTGVTQLTSDTEYQETSPSASPDGSRIVFNRFGQQTNDVWVVNVDGSGAAKLIDRADAPAWSSDGSKIALEAYPGPMLSVANQDGSGPQAIVDLEQTGLFGISAMAWAPDGTQIVFSAFTKVATGRIYVVGADGSGLSEIASGKDFVGGVAWSPDGKKIAYDDGSAIFLIDPDGKNETKLIDKGSEPAWSPDGRLLAYRTARGVAKGFSIHTVHADGSGDTILTDDPVKIFGLCWTGA